MHEWLRSRHDSMATPQPLIDRWVRVATGSAVHTAVRIIVGQDNEVHDVVTTDGHRIIVRISHRPDPRFTGERWALDAARALGVPTPGVLLIDQVDHVGPEGTPVTVCVEDKLPGVSLRTLLDAGHRPTGAIAELGELVARIHQVRVDGFGYLRAEGRGWDIPFSAVMLDLLDRRTDLHRAATHWAEPVESVEQGLAVLDAHRSHFAFDDPRLVHGDLGVDHILISDDRVTGIIDFQECSGNHPVLDLAHWELTHHHLVPTAELLTGYQRAGPVGITTGPLFALALLRESLWMLLVRAEQRLGHDIEVYRTALHQQLAQFRAGTSGLPTEVEDGTTRSE